MHNLITEHEKESQKYLFGWTLCFDRTLQNKEMKQKKLN